jgi:hypothetical protein
MYAFILYLIYFYKQTHSVSFVFSLSSMWNITERNIEWICEWIFIYVHTTECNQVNYLLKMFSKDQIQKQGMVVHIYNASNQKLREEDLKPKACLGCLKRPCHKTRQNNKRSVTSVVTLWNIYKVLIPVSWHMSPKTLECLSDKSVFYMLIAGGKRPLYIFRSEAGHQRN